MSDNWQRDVLEFHRAMCPEQVGTTPAMPGDDIVHLRVRLIEEEVGELRDALLVGDVTEAADAIVDSIVVLLGTAVAMGLDVQPAWDEVHRTNMAKVGGERRSDGKRLKPPGWQPPDIAGVLARQCSLEAIYPEAGR